MRETEQMAKRMKSRGESDAATKPQARTLDLGAVREALVQDGFAVSTGANKLTISFRDDAEVARFLNTLG